MLVLLSAGIAPGLALLSYFYLRDQYEQEPIRNVFKTFLFGSLITFPIMFVQYVITSEEIFANPLLSAFISASFLEEFVKWFVLFIAVYQHAEFDAPFDGIVYGASISLGFATVENILYLSANGISLAFGRALLPVSSHALFGVIMGYYFGKAKFLNDGKGVPWIILALIAPFVLHGLYDYILLYGENWIYYIVPFMLFLWWLGLRKVKQAHLLTQQFYEGDFREEKVPF